MGPKTDHLDRLRRIEEAHAVKSDQLRLLSEVVRTANSILDPDSLMAYIMERVQVLVRSEAWSLLLLDETGGWLIFKEALGDKAQPLKESRIRLGEGVAGEVARTGRPLIVNDVKSSPYFNPDIDRVTRFKTRSILCVPLRSRGKTLGVLEVLNKQDNMEFTDTDLETTLLFAEPCAVALENAYLFQKVKQLSLVDDLTQLYNSRYLGQALDIEITRGRRYNYPVTVVFLDLDGFKGVNDRYGHLVGSETLKIVGRIIKDLVRNVDIVARYGGDEFTLILPNTDLEAGRLVAERLRLGIMNHDYQSDPGFDFKLSASFGIAGFPVHGDSSARLIQRADQAMYKVKESTKNGCAIFE
jgi:diguanylate cyclase (GGDEF)-like protein